MGENFDYASFARFDAPAPPKSLIYASHDLEDFVAVIEGRKTLLQEMAESPQDLQDYLAEAAKSLLAESRFIDVLPGFVLDSERVPMIRERLATIAAGVPRSPR